MRDRYRGLGALLSFLLAGQALALGYQNIEPHQALANQQTEGTVSFDLYYGYLMVARGSAGPVKGLNFLLDTGASPTVLDPRLAQKLQLEQFPASLAVLGGRVQAETAIVPSLNVGPMQMDNRPVLIEDLSFLQKTIPVRLDGVIGLDVLGQSAFVIDYVARQIHFGPLPALPDPVPLHMQDGLAMVDAEVNGVPVQLLVDTGASSLTLFGRKIQGAADLKISAAQPSPKTIGDLGHRQVRLHSLRLGHTEFKQETAFVVPDGSQAGQAFDGLMSPAALGITRVAIDLGRREMAFSR